MRGGKVVLFVDPEFGRRHRRPRSARIPSRQRWPIIPRTSSRCSRTGASTTTRPRSSATWSADSKCAPACNRRPSAISASLASAHGDMNQKDVVSASAREDQSRDGGVARRACRRQDHLRAVAVEFRKRRAHARPALQRPHRPLDSARRFQADRHSLHHRRAHHRTGAIRVSARSRRRIRSPLPVRRSPHLSQSSGAGQYRRRRRYGSADGLHVGANAPGVRPARRAALCQQRRFRRQHSRQPERQQRADQRSRTRDLLAAVRAR